MIEYLIDLVAHPDLVRNLLAEGIGIFITVIVIDQWFKCRERKKWEKVEREVRDRIAQLLNGLLTTVRAQMKIPFDLPKAKVDEPTEVYIERLNQAGNSVFTDLFGDAFAVRARPILWNMGSERWVLLVNELATILKGIQTIIGIYGSHLEADLLHALLELEDKGDSMAVWPRVAPEVFDSPERGQVIVNLTIEELRKMVLHVLKVRKMLI